MADDKKQQLTIWGRANSVNVQKVLWCLPELDLAYERIDAGMAVRQEQRGALSGDESQWPRADAGGRRLRAVGIQFGHALSLHSPMARVRRSIRTSPKARAGVDRWLDWTLSTLQPVDRPVFWALVRTPPEKRDMVAIQKDADAEAVVMADRRGAAGDAALHRGRPVHDRRYRARRLCAALARGRRRHQAEAAEPRTLVCAVRRPPRLRPVHRAADDVI